MAINDDEYTECPYCHKHLTDPREIFQHLTRHVCQGGNFSEEEIIRKKLNRVEDNENDELQTIQSK